VEISVTEEVLVTMSAGGDWLSSVASASDKDTPVPEATDGSTSTCKCRKTRGYIFLNLATV